MKSKCLLAAVIVLLLLCLGLAQAETAPTITQQPKNVTANCGQTFSLNLQASGENLSYQWYILKAGSSSWTRWKNMKSAIAYGCASESLEGAQFKCVVTNSAGSATSKTIRLTVAPTVNGYSASCTGKVGKTVELTAPGHGPGIRYQWYYRLAGSNDWTEWSGKTSSSCTFTLEQRHNGMQFDCRITASNGLMVSTFSERSWLSDMTVHIEPDETPLPTSEITLYYLNDTYADFISIPSSQPQSHDLSGHTLKILSGDTAAVNDGIIAPKPTTWYCYQLDSGYWVKSTNPTGRADEVVNISYSSGDTVIRVDDKQDLTVHVTSYAAKYSRDVMDAYLKENITAAMTDYQKAEKCCQFVAGYSYGADSSSAEGMIVTGSGDCWASVDALKYMLGQLGLDATSRYAGYMAGAGSGHYNIIASLDGLYYILEAGYVGAAPRSYTITGNASPFVYHKNSDGGITITDFINIHNVTELEIPDYIDGLPVTVIDSNAFRSNHDMTRVVLPKALKSIGEGAFYQNGSLRSIDIPATVTSIGKYAFCWCKSLVSVDIPAAVEQLEGTTFWGCTKLQSINVDPKNTHYKSSDGVLYTYDMRTLLTYPAGRPGSYDVPDGVVKIPGEAFALACKIDTLNLPSTLRVLEERSFYEADIAQLNFSEGMTSIPSHCFLQSDITEVNLPEELERIEDYAFYSSGTQVMALPQGLEYIGKYAFAGDVFLRRVLIPASVKTIGAYAFALNLGWSSMGDNSDEPMEGYIAFDAGCDCEIEEHAFSDVLLCVYPGSTAHAYAQANNVPFVLTGENVLKDEWFKALSSTYTMTDKPVTPEIETLWKATPCFLTRNCDYRVDYANNDKPGTATVTITGIGNFTGTVTRTFKIELHTYSILLDTCGGDRVTGPGNGYYGIDNKIYGYIQVTYGQPYGVLPTPVRKGCRFFGWYTAPEGGEQVTEQTLALSKDDRIRSYIYAHWDSGDMNGDGENTVEDDIIALLGYAPTRVFRLPADTAIIDPEAFVNTGVQVVYIPAGIAYINDNAFDSDVLLVLPDDSFVSWAKSNNLKYVINH